LLPMKPAISPTTIHEMIPIVSPSVIPLFDRSVPPNGNSIGGY
jgi:hypothetical protein